MRRHISIIATVTVLVVTLALSAAACSVPLPNPFSPSPTPTPTPTSTPTPLPVVPQTPEATATPAVIDVVWWTPVWFSPESGDPAGEFLAERLREFEEAHPTIRVRVEPKLPSGKGGVADYLQRAYRVAPSLLPDLVTVDLNDLPSLSALGIFQPLDNALPAGVSEDFYPLALQGGLVNGERLAVQFEAHFYHLAYRPEKVPTPPANWESLLNGNVLYLTWVFSGGDDVSDVVVFQYAASGGDLPTEEGVPVDEQALFAVFNFYDQAFRRGIIPEQGKSALTADALWAALQNDEVPMVDVSARRYLREGVARVDVAAAAIPTWDGKPRALARGWGLALTASDPTRREAARALLMWLLGPDTLGPWTQMAGYVPTRRSALETWSVPSTYRSALDAMLENAISYPAHPAMMSLRRALNAGLRAMVEEGVSPEEAVTRAREAYVP